MNSGVAFRILEYLFQIFDTAVTPANGFDKINRLLGSCAKLESAAKRDTRKIYHQTEFGNDRHIALRRAIQIYHRRLTGNHTARGRGKHGRNAVDARDVDVRRMRIDTFDGF